MKHYMKKTETEEKKKKDKEEDTRVVCKRGTLQRYEMNVKGIVVRQYQPLYTRI